MTEVKVHQSCADKFIEEEVSGDCLISFNKTEILDLGIKHGPAVKIAAYLESLRKGSKHQSEFPQYVEKWTKEQVSQWLVQHVKVYSKYGERLQEEDVSGDCLVCFRKQDLVDLDVKSGPAVKILSELKQLNQKPEPTLQPILHTDQREATKPTMVEDNSKQTRLPFGKTSEEEVQQPKLQNTGARKKQSVVVKFLLSFIHRTTSNIMSAEPLTFKREMLYVLSFYLHLFSFHTGMLKQMHPSNKDVKKEANQGDKLKDLLSCGGNSLDNYDRFVVIVNKSCPEQVQYLQFLTKMKLFCVLDFDPNSAASGGLCHSYRESRVANLHTPSQFQGQTETVMKNLNLYKQTSWVFCNGRHDLDNDSDLELDYKNWLRKTCRDVEQLVSFICNPDVLPRGRYLIIFLLLSPVDTEKNPVFDIYKSFIKNTGEENIISICESQSTYMKWRELIKEKCDFDTEPLSINELTLSEINGTIMAMGPVSQLSVRLLPSPGSSAVVLKQRDEDFLTALDVLCMNQCENIYDENSLEFREFRIRVEQEFYRGGKVKWWNFYFCDKDEQKPFIKRDKYENLKKMIRSQCRDSNLCVLLNLFHHPGCGGTTLAMHVMWNLRQEFRCAVLKDNSTPKTEVALQVIKLMKLESEKPSPVLLLIDDSKETENPYDLVTCIRKAAAEENLITSAEDAPNCKVIILNCVRSHSPMEQYKQHNQTQNQYITASLTSQEQKDFEKKLKELEETHEKPENFYSFMIMKNNFDQKYIDKLAHNTLENFDSTTKEAQLFAFLALLNTYVAESEIALSLCEDFFGMKMIRWPEDSVLDKMKQYSNLLIIDRVEEWGGYKGLRILHHTIASACLAEVERSCCKTVSDITMQMLHYDLFFSAGVVKHRLMLSIQRMLIERQRKKDGDEREQFSPLIHKIHKQQGRQTVQEIFVKASSRFVTSVSIPQALARYLYIHERDFPEALKWAEKAKDIKENPYTFDTIGQVYKSNLKSNMDREKHEKSHNPEDLHTNIKIANSGMKAFQRAQKLSDLEDKPQEETPDDDSEDYPRKSYNVYGYVRMLEIAFLVFESLSRLPFFEQHNPMKKKYLQSFLRGTIRISNVPKVDNEINNRYDEIINEHERFLVDLKSEVKEIFDFLDCYFAYIKAEFDAMNHRTVSEHFKKYVQLFCTTPEEMKKEKENQSNLTLKLDIEERKLFLEKNQADTFSGILQHLDKPAKEMERITECYAFLQENTDNQQQNVKMKINYILSNIVLYHLKPKSKHVKSHRFLSTLLLGTLQSVGLWHSLPDPYYLALLLLWPSPTEENTEIGKYVTAIRKSSYKHLASLFHKRSTVAHFYLTKEDGLKKLVSKPKLDESFLPKMPRDILAQLWRNGDIFKEKAIINRLHRVSGTIEQGDVYANYGTQKILVRPARISGIRSGFSTEKVSFYLGFAINGPLAYDIKYEN
uniref:Sterile alpha motif domain containing 9 n=1 Tax=Amphilophus citrinellus TaxID=61819 RepID=A0A3Q0R9H3_AMPCI